jgi:hypothetical protein
MLGQVNIHEAEVTVLIVTPLIPASPLAQLSCCICCVGMGVKGGMSGNTIREINYMQL